MKIYYRVFSVISSGQSVTYAALSCSLGLDIIHPMFSLIPLLCQQHGYSFAIPNWTKHLSNPEETNAWLMCDTVLRPPFHGFKHTSWQNGDTRRRSWAWSLSIEGVGVLILCSAALPFTVFYCLWQLSPGNFPKSLAARIKQQPVGSQGLSRSTQAVNPNLHLVLQSGGLKLEIQF